MKHNLIRVAAMTLALLLLVPTSLAGCNPSRGTPEGTTAPDTGALPIETETQSPDAFENTILLAADKQTEYTIIVPDYAAAWELEAADRLAADLISDGNRLAIKQGYVCKAVGESAAEDIPTLTGAYAESISYANSVVYKRQIKRKARN